MIVENFWKKTFCTYEIQKLKTRECLFAKYSLWFQFKSRRAVCKKKCINIFNHFIYSLLVCYNHIIFWLTICFNVSYYIWPYNKFQQVFYLFCHKIEKKTKVVFYRVLYMRFKYIQDGSRQVYIDKKLYFFQENILGYIMF